MLASLMLICVWCANCARGNHGPDATNTNGASTSISEVSVPIGAVRTKSRYGIGCFGFIRTGATPNPLPPPESYLISDVGKPGFPALTKHETWMVRTITHYVHSPTLRLAWLAHGEFVVFDATDGPCADFAPGYPVLNGVCNDYYQPGENPYSTSPGPTEIQCAKRPWLNVHREEPRGHQRSGPKRSPW